MDPYECVGTREEAIARLRAAHADNKHLSDRVAALTELLTHEGVAEAWQCIKAVQGPTAYKSYAGQWIHEITKYLESVK